MVTKASVQRVLREAEEDNTRLRTQVNRLMDEIDTLKEQAGIRQASRIEQLSDPNMVAINVIRIELINGGWGVRDLAVVVGIGEDGPSIVTAIDDKGIETKLKREEEITALCHANGGWYDPRAHTE